MLQRWLDDINTWWQGMTPEFTFLLALPFIVGALGLWADRRRRRKDHASAR